MKSTDEQDLIRLTSTYLKAAGALAVAKKELEAKQVELCPVKVGMRVKSRWRSQSSVFEVTHVRFNPDDDPLTRGSVYGVQVRKNGTISRNRRTWLGSVDNIAIVTPPATTDNEDQHGSI